MGTLFRLAAAFAAGAAAMYYFDPQTGRRRRALVRDQGVAAGHDIEHVARTSTKRAADRVQGAAARTRARVAPEPVGDPQLHERIRARLGHMVERPGDVDVQVRDGHVVLSGSAHQDEIQALLRAVAAMPGVEGVDNLLSTGGPEGGAQQAH